ncbi:MAG: endonuclease/exonuclease/phosphatase family protein [Chthoniobacterales bacterium]|nr:endonuclease/exonuclease/phosphatase family protein [Chthoniobacterales bacterium]
MPAATDAPKSKIVRWLRPRCVTIAWVIVLCAVLGELGRFHWALDLFSHFRLQYSAGLLVLIVAFCMLRRWKAAALVLAALVWMLWPIAPYWLPQPPPASSPEGLRLLSFNVHTANERKSDIAAAIRKSGADMVALYEVDPGWVQALEGLAPEYRITAADPREDNFGIVLLSRNVEHTAQIRDLGPAGVPSILVQSTDPRFRGTLVFTHPVPPVGREGSELRNSQLEAVAEFVRQTGTGNILVAGDLNATPWSSALNPLWAAGLRDLRKGFGISPTWMRGMPWISIPIDHVLGGPEVEVHAFELLPEEGSDHTAISATISNRSKPEDSTASTASPEGGHGL